MPEFEWDEHNEDKLLVRHNVSALEAEQCFVNPSTRRREGDALLLLGVTDGGRKTLTGCANSSRRPSLCE